jgi:Rrf2 family nitric oxide-sensitive transcriptional repressor
MPFSQSAEYALRAVVWLAQNPGEPQTTTQLAEGTQVSAAYLPKVLQPLGRAEIVTSQRGINGGYTLDRDPAGLSVLEVVECVEPIHRITSCPLKINSHGANLCPMHRAMDDALRDLRQRFGALTIAALLREESGSKPLCESDPPVVSLDLQVSGSRKKSKDSSSNKAPDASPNK